MEAGKHVFCEKPVAVDARGVRAVLATCEAAEKIRGARPINDGLFIARSTMLAILGRMVTRRDGVRLTRPWPPVKTHESVSRALPTI